MMIATLSHVYMSLQAMRLSILMVYEAAALGLSLKIPK